MDLRSLRTALCHAQGQPGLSYGVRFLGTFQNQTLASRTQDTAVGLRTCSTGEHTSPQGCLPCKAPDYVFDPSATSCSSCPAGSAR
jgi:hypothetical protein